MLNSAQYLVALKIPLKYRRVRFERGELRADGSEFLAYNGVSRSTFA